MILGPVLPVSVGNLDVKRTILCRYTRTILGVGTDEFRIRAELSAEDTEFNLSTTPKFLVPLLRGTTTASPELKLLLSTM
jgi:hypothetical protein